MLYRRNHLFWGTDHSIKCENNFGIQPNASLAPLTDDMLPGREANIKLQAFETALLRHWILKRKLCELLHALTLRAKMSIPVFNTFTTSVNFRLCAENPLAEEKNNFSLGDFRISPKNRIQPAVNV